MNGRKAGKYSLPIRHMNKIEDTINKEEEEENGFWYR